MKQCLRCKIDKDESEFLKSENCEGGLAPYCAECESNLMDEIVPADIDKAINKLSPGVVCILKALAEL